MRRLLFTGAKAAGIYAISAVLIVVASRPVDCWACFEENMVPQAQVIWDGLEFRTPAILRSIEYLSDVQLRWQPPNGANSIAWLLWHIPEVEDNWVRDKLLHLPKRYPFGESVKARAGTEWPNKAALVTYFREVRALTRERLEQTGDEEFDRVVSDEHFGSITVRQVWGGVVTSCAWHGGQIVLIVNRLLPSIAVEG